LIRELSELHADEMQDAAASLSATAAGAVSDEEDATARWKM